MTDAPPKVKPDAARRSKPDGPTPVSPVIPEDVAALLFGKRPLIHGEDAAAYDDLLARIVVEVRPKDFVEWLWVKDIVDNIWEALRLRRLMSALLNIGMQRAAPLLLLPLMPAVAADQRPKQGAQAGQLTTAHLGGNAEATATLRALLARGGLDEDALAASSLELNLDTVERIDRMLTSNERRRDQILREIDQRRLVFADRLRDVSDAIIEEVAEEQP